MKISLILKLFIGFIFFAFIRPLEAALELILPKKRQNRFSRASSGATNLETVLRRILVRDSVIFESADIVALFRYREADIKKLIWDFKYRMRHYAVERCADSLYDELIADMSSRIGIAPLHPDTAYLVLHCPSSTFFRGEKTFDHMKELIIKIEKYLNPDAPFFRVCTHAVLPNVEYSAGEKAQHLGTRDERLLWASKRFRLSEEFIKFVQSKFDACPPSHEVSCDAIHALKTRTRHIYCIDDVTTTGASFGAIQKLIQQHVGIKTRCIALAH